MSRRDIALLEYLAILPCTYDHTGEDEMIRFSKIIAITLAILASVLGVQGVWADDRDWQPGFQGVWQGGGHGGGHGAPSGGGNTAAHGTPEIDPSTASGAIALLTCGVLILNRRSGRK